MRFLILNFFLLGFCSLCNAQFFDNDFTLDEFVETSPGIYKHLDYTLTIDETEIISGVTLIKQVTLSGILVLPGGKITIGGWLGSDGVGKTAEIYSGTQLLASQSLYSGNSNNDLVFSNQDTHIIDKAVIKAESGYYLFLFQIEVNLGIPGYLLSHYRNPFVDTTDILNLGTYIQNPSIGETPYFKVCTDGSTSSLFNLSYIDALIDPTNSIDFTTVNWQLRISEDPMGLEPERYGLVSQTPIIQQYFFKQFNYTHPTFLAEDAEDTIHLELIDVESGYVLHNTLILLYPAPVLMVHGLGGSIKSLEPMYDYFINLDRYSDPILYNADYQSTNTLNFEGNSNIVPEKLGLLFKKQKMNKIASGKADILAHSMGGILSRIYLQSNNYQDDINRIITLNTPHSGSQIADFIYDAVIPASFSYLFCNGENCESAALYDLRVNSDAINNLNSAPFLNNHTVPSHAVVSTTTLEQQELSTPIEWLIGLNDDILTEIFNGETHDLFVAESSQTGGLELMFNVVFLSLFAEWHSGMSKNMNVQERIEFLLKQDPKGIYYAQNGYQPFNLSYHTPAAYQNFYIEPLSVNITSPLPNSDVEYGETTTINVSADNAVDNLIISVGNNNLYPEVAKKFETNSASYAYTVTPQSLGKLNISCTGNNQGNIHKIGHDKIHINVTTDKIPISIIPSTSFTGVGVNHTTELLFNGNFDGFKVEVGAAQNIQYHFEHGFAEYIGDGKIKGLIVGMDTVRVVFNGVESEPMIVEVYESQVPVPTSINNKSENQINTVPLQAFPSPTSDYANILFLGKNSESGYLNIFDGIGRMIDKVHVTQNNLTKIDVSSYATGIYFLSLTTQFGSYSGKLTKI